MTRFAIFVFALFMCGTMSVLNAQDSMGSSDTVWVNSQLGELVKVQFCNNDQNVIVGTTGGIHLLNAADGSIIWSHLVSWVTDFVIAKDGKTFYSIHADAQIRKWNIESNKVLEQFTYYGFLDSSLYYYQHMKEITLSQDETHIIGSFFGYSGSSSQVSLIIEIDLQKKSYQKISELNNKVSNFKINRDKNIIATHNEEENSNTFTAITLYSYPSFEKIANLGSANTGGVMDMEFSADGKYIACGTDEGYVIVWDLETNSIIKKLLDPLDPVRLNSIVCYPDFSFIVAGNNGGRVWDIQNEKIVDRFWGYGLARDMEFSKNNQNLLLATTSKLVNYRTNWIVNVPLDNSTEFIYPNPSNGNVLIEYQSKKTENCEIKIINEMGIAIQNLHNGLLLEGNHRFEWNSIPFPNGIYFCNFTSPSSQKSFKIMINK